jgi:hypothetical protein
MPDRPDNPDGGPYKVGPGHPPLATRWKPGESGNPKGRTKGPSIADLLRETLEADTLCGYPNPDGRSNAQMIVEAAIRHAVKGDAAFMKEILNRTLGKVPSKVELRNVRDMTDDELRAILDTEGAG